MSSGRMLAALVRKSASVVNSYLRIVMLQRG
jgi:hypothetical protein